MLFKHFLFLKLPSLSFSLSLWGVITVVGSSRDGKRFSFPLSLPPSKLCTGYYRDLFTKCGFCLFLYLPLTPFPFNFLLLPLSCLELSVSSYVLTDAFIFVFYFFLCSLPAVSFPVHTKRGLYENAIVCDIEQLSAFDVNDEWSF